MKRLYFILATLLCLGLYHAAQSQIERYDSSNAANNNAAPPNGFPELQLPSTVNDSARELMRQVARFAQQGVLSSFAPDGGTGAAYWITPSLVPSSYISGQVFSLVPANANTITNPTFKVGNLGAVTIATISNTALAVGDIAKSGTYQLVYNGAVGGMILMGGSSSSSSGLPAQTVSGTVLYTNGSAASWISPALLEPLLPRGHIAGLAISLARISSLSGIEITAGQATNLTAPFFAITLTTAHVKRITGAWTQGNSNTAGCLDSGSVAGSTWYHVFAIRRTDTNVNDVLCSTGTVPTLPANYTLYRRIGSIRTDAGQNLIRFVQHGDNFWWGVGVQDMDVTNPGTAAVTRTLTVPSGVIVYPHIMAEAPGTNTAFLITSLDTFDTTPAKPGVGSVTTGGSSGAGVPMFKTDTSSQVRTRVSTSGAGERYLIYTFGWQDRRGRDD